MVASQVESSSLLLVRSRGKANDWSVIAFRNPCPVKENSQEWLRHQNRLQFALVAGACSTHGRLVNRNCPLSQGFS